MASSEKVHYSIFPIEGTVNDRGIILHVRESFMTAAITLTVGTTLTDFMSAQDIPKGDAIEMGYGDYVYREQIGKENNNLRFVFLKNKDQASRRQVVSPTYSTWEVLPWPDWLVALKAFKGNIKTQGEAGGWTGDLGLGGATNLAITNTVKSTKFFDRMILIHGDSYNTELTVEHYFSPEPFVGYVATEPRPMPVTYNYLGMEGRLLCIHDDITIPEAYTNLVPIANFGTQNDIPIRSVGAFFPKTNMTAWEPHIRRVIQTPTAGGFDLKIYTAQPPFVNPEIFQ